MIKFIPDEPFVISGTTLSKVYDQAIRRIWTSGDLITDQRGDTTHELRCLVTHITGPVNDYPDFGPTTERFGIDFGEGLINDTIAYQKGQDFDYGYGDRMRLSCSLEHSINLLNQNPETRRCVIPIYVSEDSKRSLEGREVPCATQLMLTVRRNWLHATLTMRSNDMVGAFPADIYGFRMFQAHVADELGFGTGTFTHFANSAHIIDSNDAQFMRKHMLRLPI